VAEVSGTYVNENNRAEFLTLRADRTFVLFQDSAKRQGTYAVVGWRIILTFADGAHAIGHLQDDHTLVDSDSDRWEKRAPRAPE
jgi:hypothetical protein